MYNFGPLSLREIIKTHEMRHKYGSRDDQYIYSH